MNPIFIVFQQNKVIVTADPAKAKSFANASVYEVSGHPTTTTLFTITGAASPYTATAAAKIKVGAFPTKENALN
jgi:hypothetical protein